jgi:hypothetical protein
LVIAIPLVVSACVSFEMTAERAATAPIMEVCKTYTAARNGRASRESGELAGRELAGRDDFTTAEVRLISQGKAQPGMSEKAGLCAWGGYWNRVNTTNYSGGVQKQYVFGDGQFIPIRYLYARNGIVSSTSTTSP